MSDKVEKNLQRLAKTIDLRTPKGYGFCLLIFPFHKRGRAQYVSSADRRAIPSVLRQMADHLEASL